MTQDNNHDLKTVDNNYTADNIRVLDGLEAVRLRPGMYIGSTDERGLHHLVYEIVYNSVDEAMAGFCNRATVSLNADGSVTVSDNGRGIPVDIHPATGTSALETVMTKLHAGAKFGGGTYMVSSGLHGVGASVVNALSARLVADVHRDGKIHRQEYHRGIPSGVLKVVGNTDVTGTTVTFLPDPEIFSTRKIDFDTIYQRLRELAYLNRDLELKLTEEATDREATFYFDGGIASFVNRLNKRRNVLHPRPIYLERPVNGSRVEVAIQYNGSFSENVFSFANCVNTIDGGSHLTGFRSALTRVLNDIGRKGKFIKESDSNLQGEDVREGLTAVVSVKLPEAQFEGQTKAKLGNSEMKTYVESVVNEDLTTYLEHHPEEAKSILEKCLTSARAREAARKARDLILKKSGFETATLPGKLADCSEKDPEECELFIVEGESAGGSAKQGRDRRFQAILPLKGKILNVEKASMERIFGHEEIRAMVTAIGVGMGTLKDINKLRYRKVIIMTDADVDGSHIRTLLLTFFYRHLPELINQENLYIAQPPLYRLQSGKQQYWLYSDREKDTRISQLKTSNYEMQRYKGLGEMSPTQLWDTTMNPDTRTMLMVTIEDAIKADEIFHILMGDEVPPRKNFIQAYAKSVKNLDI